MGSGPPVSSSKQQGKAIQNEILAVGFWVLLAAVTNVLVTIAGAKPRTTRVWGKRPWT